MGYPYPIFCLCAFFGALDENKASEKTTQHLHRIWVALVN